MAETPLRVLLVEDNPGDVRLIRALLGEEADAPFEVEWAARLSAGLERLAAGGIDLVLLDLSLPESRGLDTFRRARDHAADVPVIVLTGLDDAETALTAVHEGAEDYLVKGKVTSTALARSMRYAVERSRRRRAEARVRATEEELRIARAVQQRLFPAAAPDVPGFESGAASSPAVATGGDFFDYILLADESLAVVIGDVSGHGFGPALLMAEVRAYVRALSLTCKDIGEIVALTNLALFGDTEEDRFVTLTLARLDTHSRSLAFVNAGHETGYVLDGAGQVRLLLQSDSFPLGIQPDEEFPTGAPVPLAPGELVLLLTDGVIDARGPGRSRFGRERILDTIRACRDRSAQEIVNELFGAVRAFGAGQDQLDDMTAIVIKVQ